MKVGSKRMTELLGVHDYRSIDEASRHHYHVLPVNYHAGAQAKVIGVAVDHTEATSLQTPKHRTQVGRCANRGHIRPQQLCDLPPAGVPVTNGQHRQQSTAAHAKGFMPSANDQSEPAQ
ncbi:hypothetical protein Rhe02_15550 [Rhizocola hellebori]|uniref:Uncharacterized protein n=1 Tax=Rhizocola hellebori TaxID=1392758 RepID=A0A8J3Q552_9ACTN|nr:hypothetical protein Rhe02_15550 [Rhizocola hellebori]